MSKKHKRPSGRSSLKHHQRNKKTLKPPLASIPNMQEIDWARDVMPDYLWLASVAEITGDVTAAHKPLDKLDELISNDNILDGRISSFANIPEEKHPEARQILTSTFPYAIHDQLANALLLYPKCPANWLFEDWQNTHTINPETGINHLKSLIPSILPSRDVPAVKLKMMYLARLMKNGKIHISDKIRAVDLLPKYPSGLDEDGRKTVEAMSRAMWLGMPDVEAGMAWVEHFWKQNWQISTCEPWPTSKKATDE